jgi:hypothetical protein
MIQKSHSDLLIGYLSAAADIVDLFEYSRDEIIAEAIGVDHIWGIFFKTLANFWLIKIY